MSVRQLIFATGNPHKVKELREMLNGGFEIIGLSAIGFTEELPETQETIHGNALQKAWFVYDQVRKDCFAEDTGLEIEALGGVPGVHSAHYAGPGRDPQANMEKVLREMKEVDQRDAQFRTVIALILDGHAHTFEGIVRGKITHAPSGEGGFGYDPIFRPEGSRLTFAEMPLEEKNRISHRGRALAKLLRFLQTR